METNPPQKRKALDRVEIAVLAALVIGSVVILKVTFVYKGYRGDGTFINRTGGRYGSGADSRYEIDFGPVDLSQPGSRTFSFSGMPSKDFLIGLVISPGPNRRPNQTLLKPKVSLLLTRDNSIVIDQSAPLGDWQWELEGTAEEGVGPSFVYRIGRTVDIPLDQKGTVRLQRIGEAADQGWGTYFHPSTQSHYRLTFEVVNGDPVAKSFAVELAIRSL